MEKYYDDPNKGACFFFVIGIIAVFMGILYSNLWLFGVGVFICLFFAVFLNVKDEKKNKYQEVMELINREHEKEKFAERDDTIVNELETYKTKEVIPDEKMLITISTFEDMCHLQKGTFDMIKDICRERDFQSYVLGIKTGSTDIDNSQKMFESLKFFIIQDILRSYERLGHRYYTDDVYSKQKKCSISYDTPEGQLLFAIVMQMMKLDDNQQLSWEDFKSDISGRDQYSQHIRETAIEALNTYANADVKASASNGLDDFAFCLILHNYYKDYENSYRKKMLRIASIIANADNMVTEEENKWLDSIMNVGSTSEENESNRDNVSVNPAEELNSMIGLHMVKNEINTLCNFVIMKKKREEEGMKSPSISYHCVFTGNPGTGKTTVARLLAGIYKDLGVLKKGHLVETDRSGLVAEYVGQTAVKTNKIIDSALDGVLFIDEAYTLANGGVNDYGPEAIATLLKRMEDDRDRLVVILAGYNEEIETFINSNPGLRSRFNRYIHFNDYTASELYEIFCLQVKNGEYTLTDDASMYVRGHLAAVVAEKPNDFGNARFVRNLFEKTIESQANRIASKTELTKEDLSQITKEDILCGVADQSKEPMTVSLNQLSYLEAKRKVEQESEKKSIDEEPQSMEETDSEEKGFEDDMTGAYQSFDNGDTIEVSYSVFGDYYLDDITIDVDVKEREYDWLTEKEDEGEDLDSDFISENRKGLHKRILRAIRENIEYEQDNDSTTIDDVDIDYTVTL